MQRIEPGTLAKNTLISVASKITENCYCHDTENRNISFNSSNMYFHYFSYVFLPDNTDYEPVG